MKILLKIMKFDQILTFSTVSTAISHQPKARIGGFDLIAGKSS